MLELELGSVLGFVIFRSKKPADPHIRTSAFYPWQKLIETVKTLPCSLANGPRRIQKEGTVGHLTLLCIGCTSVVQCQRTVVLQCMEMRNFSAAECGESDKG